MSKQPIRPPVGTAEQDDRAITSQHLWEAAYRHVVATYPGSAVVDLATQLLKELLVDDPNSQQTAPLLDAIYNEINRSGGNCFGEAAQIVEECDTDPATRFAAETLREKAAAMKRTCACGRNPDPGICPLTHDGYKGGGHCTCAHEPPKNTPCSDPPCGHVEDEECDTHATARAHANGDHQWCDITCQEEFTWEKLRNWIIVRAIPGSAKALDELLRRAANRRALMDAHIALVSTLSQLRAEHAELLHRLEGLEK